MGVDSLDAFQKGEVDKVLALETISIRKGWIWNCFTQRREDLERSDYWPQIFLSVSHKGEIRLFCMTSQWKSDWIDLFEPQIKKVNIPYLQVQGALELGRGSTFMLRQILNNHFGALVEPSAQEFRFYHQTTWIQLLELSLTTMCDLDQITSNLSLLTCKIGI